VKIIVHREEILQVMHQYFPIYLPTFEKMEFIILYKKRRRRRSNHGTAYSKWTEFYQAISKQSIYNNVLSLNSFSLKKFLIFKVILCHR
jgi:hypothetical protein